MDIPPIELGWLAGTFDSEGCATTWSVGPVIVSTSREMLTPFQHWFGGSIKILWFTGHVLKNSVSTKDTYRWDFTRDHTTGRMYGSHKRLSIEKFLLTILPYMKNEQKIAEALLMLKEYCGVSEERIPSTRRQQYSDIETGKFIYILEDEYEDVEEFFTSSPVKNKKFINPYSYKMFEEGAKNKNDLPDRHTAPGGDSSGATVDRHHSEQETEVKS